MPDDGQLSRSVAPIGAAAVAELVQFPRGVVCHSNALRKNVLQLRRTRGLWSRRGLHHLLTPSISMTPLSREILDGFWSKVQKTDDCWIWTAGKTPNGYGRFSIKRKPVYAHRVSYVIEHGSISEDLCICHTCDNPSCVRPDHLFQGTHSDNQIDSVRKGRQMNVRKTHCPQGHPYSGIASNGGRICMECMRSHVREHMRKKRLDKQFVENARTKGREWYASMSEEQYQRKLANNRKYKEALRNRENRQSSYPLASVIPEVKTSSSEVN